MKKIRLKEVLEVKRGTSLSGRYYSETGEKIRLTLGNFDYPGGGFKKNTSKTDIFYTGGVKHQFILKKGDIILMCTDGLSNMVEDEDMFDIVKGARDVVEAVQMLIEKANSNGGRDNIGVIVAEPLADEVSVW